MMQIMKKQISALVVISGMIAICSCSSGPSVIERRYSFDVNMFLANDSGNDLTPKEADGLYCYEDKDVRRIKKKIIELQKRYEQSNDSNPY